MVANIRYNRVVVYKKSGAGWEGSGTVLEEARGAVVRKGIGKIKDTFEFKLTNAFNKYYSSATPTIAEDDRVTIWFWKNKIWSDLTVGQKTSAMQIDGFVSTLTQGFDGQTGRELLIKGTGFIDTVFKGLVFMRSITLTKPHTMIQNVIAQLNDFNPYRRIYGANSTEWATLGNATTQRDGTAFPDTQYSTSYKTAIEIIEDLSSHDNTDDGHYVYKLRYNDVADRYDFTWKAKTQTADSSLTEGTDTINKINMGQSKEGVINSVIAHIGYDCNESPQEVFHHDPATIISGGAKWKYWTRTQTTLKNLILKEQENNDSYFDKDDNGSYTNPYPTSYNNGGGVWTFQFETRNTNGDQTGTNATATTAKTYNARIVTEGKWLGKEQAQNLISRFGEPKWSGDIIHPQNSDFDGGELVSLTATSYGFTNFLIRGTEVHHDIFSTTLKLKEDEKSVVLENE